MFYKVLCNRELTDMSSCLVFLNTIRWCG